jgi:hypothetical protein
LAPDSIDSGQLEFPFMRARLRTEEPEMFIDWLAVTGLSSIDLSGDSHVPERKPARVGRAMGTQKAEAAPDDNPRNPLAPGRAGTQGTSVCEVGERQDSPVSRGRSEERARQPRSAAAGVPEAVSSGRFHLDAWSAIRARAGLKFGQHFGRNVALTQLGVGPHLEGLFVGACLELREQGATLEDFGKLGDFIAQDGLRYSGNKPVYQVVCEQLGHQMNRAASWHAAGRPQEGARASTLPQPARAANDDSHLLRATPDRRVRGLRDDE